MPRLLLTLQYDGTRYHGWQVQPNGVTVQQTLQDAVEKVTGVRSGITGCSRTDAGVHAAMFCCTTDTPSRLRGAGMTAALNAWLPRDIAVYDCKEVPDDFHPRYSALGKRYIYRLWNSPVRSPFWDRYSHQVRLPLDEGSMNRTAAGFVGTHDFAAFCAAGSSVQDTVRTVRQCGVSRDGELVTFSVEADGFLYNMVRIMVGTLLDMQSGRLESNALESILALGSRTAAGATAPARGLMLEKVFYPDFTM